jgi:uncharacterized protein YggE
MLALRRGSWLSVGLVGLGLAAGGCASRHIVVQAPSLNDPARGVVASGNGEAKAAPDIARTTLGVEIRADSADQATAQATEKMNAVINALKSNGVAANDLRTQNYSVNYEQEPVPPQPPQQDTGKAAAMRGYYRASNMVEVTVRDLSKLGALLARATEAGANNVWGISFDLEHPESLQAQARAKAIENAKQNAADLARLSGVKLGPIVSINESGSGQPMPMMKAMREVAQADVPVERGEITTSVQVQLVYSIAQ